MQIYKFKPRKSWQEWRQLLERSVEYTIKFAIIATLPTPVGYTVARLWEKFVYEKHLYFVVEMREFLAAGWIPSFFIMYGLFTGGIMALVFSQYMEMRLAVKNGVKERFMDYVDEELSPLWHGVATALACAVLSGFAVYNYPDAFTGELVMGAASYFFALLCFIVFEMDDPRYGFFVIRSIPEEWLKEDPRKWRERRRLQLKVTETTTVEVETAAEKPAQKAA